MALVPIGLNFDALISILKSLSRLIHVVVASRSVRVQGVILGVLLDCFGKVFNCLLVVFLGKGLGAKFFVGCHLSLWKSLDYIIYRTF
jgi:hypothetical protein